MSACSAIAVSGMDVWVTPSTVPVGNRVDLIPVG
jgi:hypothetical protein